VRDKQEANFLVLEAYRHDLEAKGTASVKQKVMKQQKK
jgi:hypothetical protein